MFRKTADKIQYPDWAKRWPRYTMLDKLDRLLDGTFYDHLPYAFYDEVDQSQKMIPLEQRRPSAQFRLPRMVARWSARKLFAGRHRPKLRFEDRKKLAGLNKLLRKAKFWQSMAAAVIDGSVGSVALTFRVEGTGDNARLGITKWRAKYCKPSFDEFGELAQLRVTYMALGAALVSFGLPTDDEGNAVELTGNYWFIRDYTIRDEITYRPIKAADWNPIDGYTSENKSTRSMKPEETKSVTHDLEFVPGQWFVNLAGGTGEDGDCTWWDAIPNSIELDYTLSQIGRGVRYNAAPQLVIKGELMNDDITRSPSQVLQVRAGYKDEDGQTLGEGGAELLEMTGTGTEAGLKVIETLRNYALEQIAAQRKDPEQMKAPLSGRAMEYLDEESNDLVMDLRSQYGEDGALPLIKKIALAAKAMTDKDVGALQLQWPRQFQPTPDELFALAQALQIAVDPLGRAAPGQPAQPGKPAGPTGAGAVKPIPEQPPTAPDENTETFMTMEEARNYWRVNLDLSMLDDVDEDDDMEVDDSPTPPSDPTETVPTPVSIDEDAVPGTPEGESDQTPSAPTADPTNPAEA